MYNFNDNIKIGKISINKKSKTFVIAEIGSNHDGSLEKAYRLLFEAKKAGADAVKFQSFKAKTHYSKFSPEFDYLNTNTYELIKNLEINEAWYPYIKSYCKKMNIEFLSSPCDEKILKKLNKLGMQAFKLASMDLTDLLLIENMAKTKKPLILSTGMASFEEINLALQTCLRFKNNNVIILQCTSIYPAPVNLSNLKSIVTMSELFNVLTGYSDHTLGDHIVLAAVTMGARVIEKHFTLDRNDVGPDHKFAMEPKEFNEMVSKIRDIESAIGNGQKDGPSKQEREMYLKGRRSIHVRRDLEKNHKITKSDIIIKRPGLGIHPRYLDLILGKKTKSFIKKDMWLTWDLI